MSLSSFRPFYDFGMVEGMMKPKWEIPSRGRTCCKGQESLLPETAYYTLLVADAGMAYSRHDYCLNCWEAETISSDATYWTATIPKRIDNKPDHTEIGERALSLLRKALESADHSQAYVLGLYLQRLRIVAARQEIQRDGLRWSLYEVLDTSEILSVPQMVLSSQQITELQKGIAQQLSGENHVCAAG